MLPIIFHCRLTETTGELPHFWEHTVGGSHATMGLRADWREQLRRCHHELGFRYVRFHGILSDGMGTLVDEQDRLLYSFFNADQIWDYLLSIGMKPFVELSFMPTALASGKTTAFNYQANVTHPKDNTQWATLIHKLVSHWVERYGVDEIRTWFFEVWNEPNLKAFWPGTQESYFEFYRCTANTIKQVDAKLQVGGPATAKDGWINDFLAYCERVDAPLDFVSTHHYPTDALGTTNEDTETQLANGQRSIMREWTQDTRRKCRDHALYYTEWNASSNPRDHLHDEPYTAAVIVKTMMEAKGLVEGYSYWTFTDIFAENYFPTQPFQGGFGLLTIQDIAKPSYRAFELLHRLGNETCLVDGIHETVDVWVVRNSKAVTVLICNQALPRHPISTEHVKIQLSDISPPSCVYIERIDDDHANAKNAWLQMGKPQFPTPRQVETINVASQLVRETQTWKYENASVWLDVTMAPHSVAAVTLELAAASHYEGVRA